MKLSSRETIAVVVLFVVVFSFVVYAYIWQPLQDERLELLTKLELQRTNYSKLSDLAGAESVLISQIEGIEAQIEYEIVKRNLGIPFTSSLVFLSDMSREIGIRVSKTDISQDIFGLSVSIELKGVFSDVYRFMQRLEAEDSILGITGMQLNVLDGEISATLDLKFFSSLLEEEVVENGLGYNPFE